MTKKSTENKRQNNLDEVKLKKENEKNEQEKQEVAKEIEILLNKYSFALQTFVQPVMELGVIKSFEGRVRLIKIDNAKPKEQAV